MKDMSQDGPAPRTVALSVSLEARLNPVADARQGQLVGIDLRLYRRLATPLAQGAFASTSAGFRVPLTSLRQLAAALAATADELGLP